mmetsp:Transcript_61139/g.149667  ORF Transcript_61139/g.149667 Transcript_61139/m.149667 type:complete len:234 (+) Transcript_61139:136-837(+)
MTSTARRCLIALFLGAVLTNEVVWGFTTSIGGGSINSIKGLVSTSSIHQTISSSESTHSNKEVDLSSSSSSSRRDVLQLAFVGLVGSVSSFNVVGVEPANADVTNKVQSTTALRNLQRCSKTLPKLSASVSEGDYLGVKSFFRTPPWDESRKNGQILVRGGEDLGKKSNELAEKYKKFISSVEKIDGSASLGIRGRTIDPKQFSQEYDSVQSTLKDFIQIAEETTDIPLQVTE